MAAAKSTKKATKTTTTTTQTKPKTRIKTTKTAAKKTTTAKTATKKTVTPKAKTTKAKTQSKASKAKTSTKKTSTKKTAAKNTTSKAKKATKNTSVTFFTDVVKLATKAQKTAQTQTKSLIKSLNALDKQQMQLVSKQNKAKGKSWQSLEAKIVKIKAQATVARTAVAVSQNNADKIATFIEWTTQLNNKPSTTAYTQHKAPTPSKPSLVKSPYTTTTNSGSVYGNKPSTSTTSKKNAKPFDEDLEEEDLDEGLNFGYDDEDELQDDLGR